jgi:2,3-bisphosphoglycerate-dependent phosphoglycerate mutase
MYQLVLVRHGQSTWNKENLFTGWKDVDLTEEGQNEAYTAGQKLTAEGFNFDIAYTSTLKRAIKTCNSILDKMDLDYINVIKAWRLNERHYGGLQGLNKKETADKFGDDQVHIWRRSYDTPPPQLELDSKEYKEQVDIYKLIDPDVIVPRSESLKLTLERVMPYWESDLAPAIKAGKKLIIIAHGNSLRALIKHIDNISDEEITSLNIPTGRPIVYMLDENLKGIKHYSLD